MMLQGKIGDVTLCVTVKVQNSDRMRIERFEDDISFFHFPL